MNRNIAGKAIPKHTIGMWTASERACMRRATIASGAGCCPSAPLTVSAAWTRKAAPAMAPTYFPAPGSANRRVTERTLRPRYGSDVPDRLRALPSVDRLATSVARAELADRRAELLAGADDDPDLVGRAQDRLRPSLRRVLNATGVVVHTNLGRAPLASEARVAVARAAEGYSNL